MVATAAAGGLSRLAPHARYQYPSLRTAGEKGQRKKDDVHGESAAGVDKQVVVEREERRCAETAVDLNSMDQRGHTLAQSCRICSRAGLNG